MKYTDPATALSLLNNIGKLVGLDEAAIEAMLNNSKEVEMPKGSIINNDKKICSYLYFIISGKARLYYVDCTGKIITWSFHFNDIHSMLKHLFFIDYNVFLPQVPGNMHIEALTDIRLIRVNQRGLGAKSNNEPLTESCLKKLHEHSFIAAYERILRLLTQSASERYNHMLHHEPYLLQLFADKYLASYLGIEPQSLSRIRKNLRSSPSQKGPVNFPGMSGCEN